MNLKFPEQTVSQCNDLESPIGFAPLLRLALSGADMAPIGTQLINRVASYPNDANALMDMSIILQIMRNRDLALSVQARALQIQQLYRFPAPCGEARIRLLAIMAGGDFMANTPLDCLLEDSDVSLDTLYVGPNLPFPSFLPDHDLVICAINESDQNNSLLRQLEASLGYWPRPIINSPDRILHLSRDGASAILKLIPGVVMPVSVRLNRQALEQLGRNEISMTDIIGDGDFPVIIRPVGSHAGQGLVKMDNFSSIEEYLETWSDMKEFYVARYVDYRSKDGLFRKYRIVLIEGQPYICHLAISDHWMIHYLNAGMAESPVKRTEEARCMECFDDDFARRHEKSLTEINERMGLEYFGLDCGETSDGDLLIFEVDVGMIVHAMDSVDVFPYKQPQMKRVFMAFRQMLLNKMKRGNA